MNTYVERNHETKAYSTAPHSPRIANSELDTDRKRWLQEYSHRLLKLWLQWQTTLGITCTYAEKIKEDLAVFYEDPLKRMFIEATYC